MLTDIQVLVLRRLPAEIRLVGGPFCGVTLFTRDSKVSDVYAELMKHQAKGAGIDHWVPVSTREIHITRIPMAPNASAEVCIYKPQRDGRWLYSGLETGTVPVQS